MTTLNPDTTALLVIDMQNDFAHPDGALYAPGSSEVIPQIQSLIDDARTAGVTVGFTRDVHQPDQFDNAHYYDEFEQWGEHVVEGSWGAEIISDFDVQSEDLVVTKPTYNAFYETELHEELQSRNIKNLVFVGTLANVCVLHTAGAAGFRDYRPVLIEDAVGYIEEEHRKYALDHADWLFGEVATTDEIAFE